MYRFRKSKKGFTLIELMVVVAIIGILVLLALRAYSSQKQRAMNAIAKANAATIQTMLVGYMGDHDITDYAGVKDALGGDPTAPLEDMVNPYSELFDVWIYDQAAENSSAFTAQFTEDADEGKVVVLLVNNVTGNILRCNALDQDAKPIWDFTHALPANKY